MASSLKFNAVYGRINLRISVTNSCSSDYVLPRRMTRERGILSSSFDWRAEVMRSSVSTTCVRVFFLLRPLRGIIYLYLVYYYDYYCYLYIIVLLLYHV